MIYNYRRGLDRQLKKKAVRGGSLALPIIAAAFLLIALFTVSSNHGDGQSPIIPAKKTGQSSQTAASLSVSPAKQTSPAPAPKPSSESSSKPAMSFSSLSSPATSPTEPATTFLPGLGGGDITSGSGGTTAPTSGSGGTSSGGDSGTGSGTTTGSTPTVVCTDPLTTAQLCTACTPPLTLQPGQKAILSSDGTCTTVN